MRSQLYELVFLSMSKKLNIYIKDLILTVKKDQHIFSIRWEGETYWVKRPQAIQPSFWHKIQKIINLILPLEIVKATIAQDASSSLAHEIKQLKTLEKKQISVPKLITQADDWVCMSNAGPTLHELLEKGKCSEKHLLKAAETLANFHEKGLYHGRAKLNDLTLINKDEIGFIDFEENPLSVMSLESAQNRDLYLFISSLCRWNQKTAEEALKTYLNIRCEKHSYYTLRRLLTLLKPIKLLSPFVHKMSKDIKQAYFAQNLFEKHLI